MDVSWILSSSEHQLQVDFGFSHWPRGFLQIKLENQHGLSPEQQEKKQTRTNPKNIILYTRLTRLTKKMISMHLSQKFIQPLSNKQNISPAFFPALKPITSGLEDQIYPLKRGGLRSFPWRNFPEGSPPDLQWDLRTPNFQPWKRVGSFMENSTAMNRFFRDFHKNAKNATNKHLSECMTWIFSLGFKVSFSRAYDFYIPSIPIGFPWDEQYI